MTGPKIDVSASANLQGIYSELDKLKAKKAEIDKAMSGGEVGFDVKKGKADLDELDSRAKAVADQLKALRQGGSPISKDVLKDISSTLSGVEDTADVIRKIFETLGQSDGFGNAVKDTKSIADNLHRSVRSQEALNKGAKQYTLEQAEAAKGKYDNWVKSGARGTHKLKGMEFDDWISSGWRMHAIDEVEAKSHRNRIMQAIGLDPEENVNGVKGGGRNSGGWLSGLAYRSKGAAVLGGLMGVGGAFMRGGDGIFSALGSAGGGLIGAGAGAAFGGPIGGAVGLIAGQALGGIGQMLDQSIERVIADNSNMTDLRHSLGATKVDFDDLQGSMRYFSKNLGLLNGEVTKLGQAFAVTVGRDMTASQVSKGVSVAAGIGRGYGMDPGDAVQFFASMRRMGITSDLSGDRRLALMIGEAVAVRGITPRMSEMMKTVETFVDTSTRNSLTAANTTGFVGFMSGLMGTGAAGIKDPSIASSAMMSADAALRQGGAFGDASKAFSLGLYQRMLPGFNVFDMKFLNDQGAFGSVSRAFGENSNAYQLAKMRGDAGAMRRYRGWAKAGGDQTIISMQMKALEQTYGGLSSEEFALAGANHLGVNVDQFSALYRAFKSGSGLGNLQKQMKAAGINPDTATPQSIAALAQVSTMDEKQLRAEAARISKDDEFSNEEKKPLLDVLKKGDDANVDELRKVVMGVTASHDTTKDMGSEMRAQNATMKNIQDELMNKLIPYVQSIKDGVIALLLKIAPESAAAQRLGQQQDRENQIRQAEEYDKQMAGLQAEINGFDVGEFNKETRTLNGRRDKLEADLAAAKRSGNAVRAASIQAELDEVHRKIGDHNARGNRRTSAIAEYNEVFTKRFNLPLVEGAGGSLLDPNTGKPTGKFPALTNGNNGRGVFASAVVRNATRDKIIAEAQRQGLSPEETSYVLALSEHESGFNPYAAGPVIKSGANAGDYAYGPFQYMALSSKGWNRFNLDQNISHGVSDFKKNSRAHGVDWALAKHHGNPNVPEGVVNYSASDGYQTNQQYIDQIKAKAKKYTGVKVVPSSAYVAPGNSKPPPVLLKPKEKTPSLMDGAIPYDPRIWEGSGRKVGVSGLKESFAQKALRQSFEHRITLLDRDGNEVGGSVVQTRVGEPVPQGVGMA